MRDVAIVGVGQTPVGEHWDSSLRMLASEAVRAALSDANVTRPDAVYVGSAYGHSYSSQSQLGALIVDYAGLTGVEAFSMDAADASGGAALRMGYLAVASGAVDTVVVVGVEKSTDAIGSARVLARNTSLDADYEAVHGATLPALAALLMRRYMHAYQVDLPAFEGFSINAHSNGKRNPNAMYQNTLKPGAFAKAPMVAEPVSLFDSAPDGDGAAAVVITTADLAQDLVPQPVRIVGSSAATDTFTLHDRKDVLWLSAVQQSTEHVLAQAGISRNELDLFELHDAYTILTTLTLEAAGFADRGTGWQLANESRIGLGGDLPISTFGGLKSRGNPAGAAGVYQAVEAVLQLRGEAGANQVQNARTALIQSVGGLASTVVSHVLRV